MYENGFWVFGYGSLLWRPGFDFTTRQKALLKGFRRSFCMYSVTYRGTAENPGLVLALDPHHSENCHGVAFHVAAENAVATHAYLQERELISSAYNEQNQTVELEDGSEVNAICYVINRDHSQYTGEICLETQAEIIARASGNTGPNHEYLFNTVSHLNDIGIHDTELNTLVALVKARQAVSTG